MTRRTTISTHTITALIIGFFSIGFFLAEQSAPSTRWRWIELLSLPALLIYLWMLYKHRRAALFTSTYQIVYWAGILASALAISAGTYIIEIEQIGTANGTFWVALLFFIGGMEATVFGYRAAALLPSVSVERFSDGVQKLAIFASTGIALVLSAYILVEYRGPVLGGLDRLTFWSTSVPPLLEFIPNLVTQTFFFAAFYYLWKVKEGRSRWLAAAIVLGYLVAGLLVLGEKYSLYVLYLNTWLFLIPALTPSFKLNRRGALIAGIAAVCVLTIVALTYLSDGREVNFILTRVALQAQLLWSAIGSVAGNAPLPRCFFGCGFEDGRDYISQLYLPHHRYEYYASIGNDVSGFTPALPIIAFGLPGAFVVYLAASFVLGWVQRRAIIALSNNNLFYGFLIFKLHFGLSLLIATTNMTALRGIVAMLVAVILYHLAFPRWKGRPQHIG